MVRSSARIRRGAGASPCGSWGASRARRVTWRSSAWTGPWTGTHSGSPPPAGSCPPRTWYMGTWMETSAGSRPGSCRFVPGADCSPFRATGSMSGRASCPSTSCPWRSILPRASSPRPITTSCHQDTPSPSPTTGPTRTATIAWWSCCATPRDLPGPISSGCSMTSSPCRRAPRFRFSWLRAVPIPRRAGGTMRSRWRSTRWRRGIMSCGGSNRHRSYIRPGSAPCGSGYWSAGWAPRRSPRVLPWEHAH